MKRSFILLLLICSAFCTAEPQFLEEFVKKYAPTGELAKLECRICHTQPPQRNPYGRAVNDARRTMGKVDGTLLASLESADSDGDRISNGEEIRAGTPPGDQPAAASGTDANPAQDSSLLPKHGFHPTVVHFPIALFIFGALLEFLGWHKKDQSLRKAGWLCLLAGSITSFGAAGSGLLAVYLNQFEIAGGVLLHLVLAVSSTILMLTTVLWRRKGEHDSIPYLAFLLLTAILVGVTGHFGGQLVYG